MKKINIIISFILFLITAKTHAQETDSISKKDQFVFSGYVKQLSTLSFNKDLSDNISGGLIHNRMNLKWKLSTKLIMAAEFRNRLFWGETIKINREFSRQLSSTTTKWDLSSTWINTRALLFHSNTERMYIDIKEKRWNIRLGRQRVNWGMTTTWNPNDIFNAYNFLDIDYEERAGVDAAKVQYQINDLSNLEVVHALTKNNNSISAVKYFINKGNYDLQVTTGLYNDRPVVGAGWAGSIDEAGFKGEVQYFMKTRNRPAHLNLSTEIDYVFEKGWYTSIGVLYNSVGLNRAIQDFNQIDLKLSAENLMPTRWSLITVVGKDINPLSRESFSLIYSPGLNMLILMNNLSYNLCANIDVDLVWQSFFAELNSVFQSAQHVALFRLKWSF